MKVKNPLEPLDLAPPRRRRLRRFHVVLIVLLSALLLLFLLAQGHAPEEGGVREIGAPP